MSGNAGRMKVLFLPGWYPSEDNPVAGVFVREQAKAVSLYDDVVVLYVRPATRQIRGLYTVTERVDDGIRVIQATCRLLPIPKTTYFLWLYLLWAIFRRLKGQGLHPDVIHAHIYYAGVAAAILGRLFRVPVVISEHSSAFGRGLLGSAQIRVARIAMKRADRVLVVSNALQHHIEEYGIRARFQVVPNTVATDVFHPGKPDGGGVKDESPKRLLTVALLTPVKGIPYLLDALHRLRKRRQDFVLDIVGDGENRGEYEAMADALDLDGVVRFHGLKSRDEVAEFMRRCDFLVQPSEFETFGVVVIEALASGKPVVASDVGGLRETISKEVGSLVPPKDPDALASTIDDMLDSYEDYSAQAIASYARERYSYEVVGKMLHDIYLDVT